MFVGKKGTLFCDCGRILENKNGVMVCPRCKGKITKETREKIGRYGGFSTNIKGNNG